MIPRAQPNYSLPDVISSFFAREGGRKHKDRLIALLGSYFGSENIILTQSGRGAIHILLSCLGRPKVFVPAYTCKAVIEACRIAGKEIHYVEAEEGGFNMDPDDLRGRLDSSSVLLLTHQFGFPARTEELLEAAALAGAAVVEDACASFGTRYKGRLTGTFGDGAAFSFDSTKLLNCPLKGGFILAKDEAFYRKCRDFAETGLSRMPFSAKLGYTLKGLALKTIGLGPLYSLFHLLFFRLRGRTTDESLPSRTAPGPFYTFRMGEFQARPLVRQMERLDDIVSFRRELYGTLLEGLKGCDSLDLPPEIPPGEWVPVRFPVRVKGDKLSFYRDCVRMGVDLGFSFTHIETPPQYARAHELAGSVLNLPYHLGLGKRAAMKIVRAARAAGSGKG
jgi:dTDP-4-amino-4,6-dideoxygalactose transaminase